MVPRDNAAVCDGLHKNAVLLLKPLLRPLELLEAAQIACKEIIFLASLIF
jgi:hypothetical protein